MEALTAAVKNQMSKTRSSHVRMSLSPGKNDITNGPILTIRKPSPPAKATLPQREPGIRGSSGTSYFFLGNATSNIARPGPHSRLSVAKIDCWPPYPMLSIASIMSSEPALLGAEYATCPEASITTIESDTPCGILCANRLSLSSMSIGHVAFVMSAIMSKSSIRTFSPVTTWTMLTSSPSLSATFCNCLLWSTALEEAGSVIPITTADLSSSKSSSDTEPLPF